MKNLIKHLENLMTAITFAEEGLFEEAKKYVPVKRKKENLLENLMLAVTFAEAGEFEEAKRYVPIKEKKETVLENLMMAVAFAEAGELEEAKRFLLGKERDEKRALIEDLETKGIRLTFLVVTLK